MGYFGIPFRNGVPIGLGSIAGFGAPQEFSPSELFLGGTAGAWYDPSDLTTLFTTSAGTTQCAMPGQGSAVSVGLMLDKSQNGVGTNGAKRVNLLTYSEQFDNAAWTRFNLNAFGSGSVANTTATLDPLGGNTADYIQENTSNGQHAVYNTTPFSLAATQHTASIYAKAAERNWLIVNLNTASSDNRTWFDLSNGTVGTNAAGNTAQIVDVGNGWYKCSVTRTTATDNSYFQPQIANADGSFSYTGTGTSGIYIWGADLRLTSEASTLPTYQRIDANWYSTMAGNHAIAFNDTTARPELRARVNLLTYSEEFDNGVWVPQGATISTNTTTAPDGTLTADTLTENTATGSHRFNRFASGSTVANASFVYSIALKANTRTYASVQFATGAVRWTALVDLSAGTIVTTRTNGSPTGTAASITSLGNGWYRVSLTIVALDTGPYIEVCLSDSATPTWTGDSQPTYTGNGTGSIFIWGADLRPANIGANVPAYQRISDANTYDTSGFPLYLRFDGIDDSMYTPANLNLSGTDKVSVFAGVRKLSDGVLMLTEFGPVVDTTNGSFALLVPGAARWSSRLRGTAYCYYDSATYTAPITNVIATSYDIAGAARADEIQPRINGVLNQTNGVGADAGTGNFSSLSLFIGSRNNASVRFNGHLHSLIIAGSAASAGNISATEQWVAGKTGITI